MEAEVQVTEGSLATFYSTLDCEELVEWLETLIAPYPLKCLELGYRYQDDEKLRRSVHVRNKEELQMLLYNNLPTSLHIGGLQTTSGTQATQVTRITPLRLDFDFDDYERKCCGDTKRICTQCWGAIGIPSIQLLDELLQPYGKRTFVFSGSKGFHVWVASPWLISWSSTERSALLAELEQAFGSQNLPFYPDKGVSIQVNHQTRCPNTVNPKSGRIAVCIDTESDMSFESLVRKHQGIRREEIPKLQFHEA